MSDQKSKWLYSSVAYPVYRICDRCAEAFEICEAEQEWNYCPRCGAEMEESDGRTMGRGLSE